MSLLTAALEGSLDVQWKDQYECVLNPAAPPISLDASQRIIEVLKILFNITHSTHRQEPSEVSDIITYARITKCIIDLSASTKGHMKSKAVLLSLTGTSHIITEK